MGRLGWTLLFGSLFVVALALLSIIGLRLWRAIKALGRDLERASGQLAEFASARDSATPR